MERINLANSSVAVLSESDVQGTLSLTEAIEDLSEILETASEKDLLYRGRVRVDPRGRRAWMHTLRAGLVHLGVVGGKDYTSIDFSTPAMWVTVASMRTGKPLAIIEADFLSRLRTAAVTALATKALAPAEPEVLAHFGAGKISELLIRGVLTVRPSLRRVLLVRNNPEKRGPAWLDQLRQEVSIEVVPKDVALGEGEVITTATSSRQPVICANMSMPRARHFNLVGANHLKRWEIDDQLAARFVTGGLVADDPAQVAAEAGDFVEAAKDAPAWSTVRSLAELVRQGPFERPDASAPTAFKSVGVGLMDLALAAAVLRRLGLL